STILKPLRATSRLPRARRRTRRRGGTHARGPRTEHDTEHAARHLAFSWARAGNFRARPARALHGLAAWAVVADTPAAGDDSHLHARLFTGHAGQAARGAGHPFCL